MSFFVVKVGGEVVADRVTLGHLAADIRALSQTGPRLIVVHGGGPQATELAKRLGLTPRIVGGRRVTDAETLEVMKMVLAGTVNLALVSALTAAGLRPVGLSGPSAGLLAARRRPPRVITGGPPEPVDLGFVGDVHAVNTHLLEILAQAGYLPVIACLGADAQGQIYNINADIVAAVLAEALQAERLFHLTGTPGVLRNPDDPDSRIPRLTASEAKAGIAQGSIRGGMIPKIEESLKVLGRGIGAIHIVGISKPGALVAEAREPGSVGTVLLPG
jgi:acetylglutamate kinase